MQATIRITRNLIPLLLCAILGVLPIVPGHCRCTDSVVCCCSVEAGSSHCCCSQASVDCPEPSSENTPQSETNDCSECCQCSARQSFVPTNPKINKKIAAAIYVTSVLPKLTNWPRLALIRLRFPLPKISHNTRQSLLAVWLK